MDHRTDRLTDSHPRRRGTAIALAITAFATGSCIGAPEPAEIRAADYGPGVFLWEAQARLKERFAEHVPFPDTAKNWKWKGPRKGWVKIGVFGDPLYGWILWGSAAHRNLVGGDSRSALFCLFRDGSVAQTWDGSEVNVVWGWVDDPSPDHHTGY